MNVWRLVAPQFAATALTGEGARRYGGRWNAPGTAVVYTASSRALAMLELLVHVGDPTLLPPMRCFRTTLPPDACVQLDRTSLPPDWDAHPPLPGTQHLGSAWARAGTSLALQVPSAVVPLDWNVVLNPAHPSFSLLHWEDEGELPVDARLMPSPHTQGA